MRRITLDLILPLASLLFIGAFVLLPAPGDYFTPKPTSQSRPTTTYDQASVKQLFVDTTQEYDLAPVLPIDAFDCLDNLANATPIQLDQCGEIILRALMVVQAHESFPEIQDSLDLDQNRDLISRLKLAALSVCQVAWAEGDTQQQLATNPACLISNTQLVSSTEYK